MQEAKDLDASRPLEAVDGDKRRAADDQLARALHPARPAHFGVLQKQVDLVLDFLVLVGRRQGVVLSDVIELLEAIAKGLGKPDEDQTPPLSSLGAAARKRQAARRWALSAIAASFETHCAAGSSASTIA